MAGFPNVNLDTDLRDGLCFCCGKNNPIGLKLDFRREGDGVRARYTPDKLHQGWPGILHGGIITCLLDEAMSYAAVFAGVHCLTAKMEVEIKSPAPVAANYILTGKVTRQTRKLVETEASVTMADGTLIATARSKQFVIGKVNEKGGASQNNASK
ncbi:MAG: PaaI family thioesterase [Dehalococcoidales bacterium]|nr:PaaI family thioesterase [Dehalococcoidales bacterium]